MDGLVPAQQRKTAASCQTRPFFHFLNAGSEGLASDTVDVAAVKTDVFKFVCRKLRKGVMCATRVVPGGKRRKCAS
jgi:hypothetical protein